MNQSPVKGWEKDVGSHTTVRLTYNSAFLHEATDDLVVHSLFDKADFESYLSKRKAAGKDSSWLVPLQPGFLEYARTWVPVRKWPSTGMNALVLSLSMCDTVDVFGFDWYDEGTIGEHAPHYWSEDTAAVVHINECVGRCNHTRPCLTVLLVLTSVSLSFRPSVLLSFCPSLLLCMSAPSSRPQRVRALLSPKRRRAASDSLTVPQLCRGGARLPAACRRRLCHASPQREEEEVANAD